ncbi:hypothetical protein OX283_004845 [Flavobacterium sp. SUN052]|uniref:hypothetical protein n=1 Tax=Flavobacterium sp. SUN052 TaxID=3002441 RepID=UPI00237D5ADD|nr:hypothetical protein [Flavobacterium sp. SUN052]MEC4003974.1 hypothetical protein [Flavobacterium sp. SUN052]
MFTKKLIYLNEGAINGRISQLNTQKDYFQNLVNRLKNNNIKVTTDDLIRLIEDPKTFIIVSLTGGENLKVGTLSINNNKLFDLMDVSDEIKSIIDDINKISNDKIKNEFYHFKVNLFCVNNGLVELTKEYLNLIENQNSVYIENKKQLEVYNIFEDFVKNLNELSKYGLNISLEDNFFKVDSNNKLIVDIIFFSQIKSKIK